MHQSPPIRHFPTCSTINLRRNLQGTAARIPLSLGTVYWSCTGDSVVLIVKRLSRLYSNRLWASHPRSEKKHLQARKIYLWQKSSWKEWDYSPLTGGRYGPENANRSYGLWTYIEGPDSQLPTDATKVDEWHRINDRIVGALCLVVENSLSQEIEKLTTAREAWECLKSKTYQSGAISKFNALQTAMCTRFTMRESVNSTISELEDLADVIYDTKPPTNEMLITLYLHAMAHGDFDWL